MYQVFITIAPLFCVILAGFLAARIKLAEGDWTKTLNLYALRIGFPTLIFTALAKSKFNFADQFELIAVNSAYILFAFGFALVIARIFKLSAKMRNTLFIIFPFGNIAYLGMPLLTEVYGNSIITQVSLMVALYLFWMFTFGIFYLERTRNPNAGLTDVLKNLLKNPLLIAVIAGAIFSAIPLKPDNLLYKTMDILARSATPVVLFSIGIFISQIKAGSLKEWKGVSLYLLVKLAALPAILYIALWLLNLTNGEFKLSVIEASMPLALTPYALSQEYEMDGEFITRSIMLTTIISVVTIPFWIVHI